MRVIKGIIRYICLFIIFVPYSIRCFSIKFFWKKKIFILNTPVHGNIGDQAILLAEKKIVKDVLPHYKIIIVPNKICKMFTNVVARIVDTSPVCLHGGGYLGDLWPNEDATIMSLIRLLHNNKMIFFPQTFCCEKIEEYFDKNRETFENSERLTIFARDIFTYDCLKKHLNNNIVYIPDVVLYEKRKTYNKKKLVTVCLRNDNEKTMNNQTKKTILESIDKEYFLKHTDMVTNKTILSYNRRFLVNKKMREIGESQLLITDRLHCMIFAYLTKTPCLVFNSRSPKLRGVYKWIQKSDYVIFHSDNKRIKDEIDEMLKRKYEYNSSLRAGSFNVLKNELEIMVKEASRKRK